MFDYLAIMQKLSRGGDWLRKAREWMQSNVIRGDVLHWSSGELVWIPFRQLEDFALNVAVAAVTEDRKEQEGPGTPKARFTALLDELEKRFPHPTPYSSVGVPELHYLKKIDELIAESMPEGWVVWDGTPFTWESPIGGSTLVLVKTRDGFRTKYPHHASEYDWRHPTKDKDWEIVSYKIVNRPL